MQKYDIAAYIWPAYTGKEPRTRMFWPNGLGEWQTVMGSRKKYENDTWPRKPLWGCVDEADSRVMEMQIDAAADYGVNVFIYDWYWYDGRPFLEQCLNDGYLKARNNNRVKFYLMWANHDANNLWNKTLSDGIYGDTTIWKGATDERQFNIVAERMMEKYFSHPSYYRIGGKPVLMIYDLENLLKGLGGVENTRRKLTEFKTRCEKNGLGGLHLQLTQWGERVLNLSGVDGGKKSDSIVAPELGFDSLTNYQFCHFTDINRDFTTIMREIPEKWAEWTAKYPIPFFPHVSVGWDNNPRFNNFRPGVITGNTPEAFESALRQAKAFLDEHTELPARLMTVNSWNEWTETSYLEPDDRNGYGYLEAIKKVFKDEK